MKKAAKVGGAVIVSILSGCAIQPPNQLSRSEWVAESQRTYKVTPDEVIEAAERVFKLSDGNDYRFQPHDNGIVATRGWSYYLVFAAGFGSTKWKIDTIEKEPGNTLAKADTSVQHSMVFGPSSGYDPIPGNAIYRIFWSRMDWMLGLRKDWPTCEQSERRLESGQDWGNLDQMCNSLNIDCSRPIIRI